ncbi:hypothetical protein [Methylobacterium sp. 77]|uniref:hypothetical protein n=1 Tax=Methylobacterium sp. 77 TaxID=1101192 RepID=UPI00039A7E36|nr:hypothetical protein [Methylobacterium sp. 77]
MLVEYHKHSAGGYAFIVYEPPAESLPWLAVCIGPANVVLGAEAYATVEEANRRIMELADKFAARADGPTNFSWSKSPLSQ